jgi:hypothetical protein
MWPKAYFAIALLCTGVAAGAAAIIQGPMKVNLVVSALPNLGDALPIKVGEYNVGWGSPTRMRAGGTLTLDLSNVQSYYSAKQNEARVSCIDMLTSIAPRVPIGPGAPNPATKRTEVGG